MAAKKNNRFQPSLENLETRELLAANISASFADGVLTVKGTSQDDRIYVGQSNGYIQVKTWQVTPGPSKTTTLPGGIVIEEYEQTWEKLPINIVKHTQSMRRRLDRQQREKTAGRRGHRRQSLRLRRRRLPHPERRPQNITAAGYLSGSEGDDTLIGGAGADNLQGWTGDDYLYGLDGDDYLQGSYDDDFLIGGGGRDKLYGYDGADTLGGVAGEDYRIDGGAGNDRVNVAFNLDTFWTYKGNGSFAQPVGTDTFQITMNLGGKGSELVGKFVEQARQFTDRLQPLVDFLNTRLPLPQPLQSPTIGELLGGDYQDIADAVTALNQFDVGAFKAGDFNLGTFRVDSSWVPHQVGKSGLDGRLPGPDRQPARQVFFAAVPGHAATAAKVALGGPWTCSASTSARSPWTAPN